MRSGSIVRAIRRLRPDIVHTHTAKAGMLGRTAAVMAGGPRPVIVHTYHGHVLEGYFGPARNAVYRGLEHQLAGVSDALIGVSQATVDDLVRLGVAPPEKFRVVPIGLDLDRFLASGAADGAEFRAESGVHDDELLLTFVGRLVPIKRVDVLLRAFAVARESGAPVRLAIVGDGAPRGELEQLAADLGVAEAVWFAGYRADTMPVAAASDIAVLSSDNEGTPVSLIEAGAAGKPAVSTDVGACRSSDARDRPAGARGRLRAPRPRDRGVGRRRDGRARMGAAARAHVAGALLGRPAGA